MTVGGAAPAATTKKQETHVMNIPSFLKETPPMGIYETLYAFWNSYGEYMGTPGTHPWSQGFPLTTQLKNGPPMPTSVELNYKDLFYPKAWGHPDLRQTIADYYNKWYGTNLAPENVMIHNGGRGCLLSVLLLLAGDVEIRIMSTEYTPYLDILENLGMPYSLVESNKDNKFSPPNEEFFVSGGAVNSLSCAPAKVMGLMSNPCNPTGVCKRGAELADFVARAQADPTKGALIDEAYELFQTNPESAAKYVQDIDNSNIFITGACTKGFQAPGIRIGWCIASKQNIATMSNYSSYGMGGVSHPSQLYALKLFEPKRVEMVRKAVPEHFDMQRVRYGEAFKKMGLTLWSGDGGFYHWVELPEGMDCEELNQRLFKRGAAILRGKDCDMRRPLPKNGVKSADYTTSPLKRFFRFSFGPLLPESFEEDVKIMQEVLTQYAKDVGVTLTAQ